MKRMLKKPKQCSTTCCGPPAPKQKRRDPPKAPLPQVPPEHSGDLTSVNDTETSKSKSKSPGYKSVSIDSVPRHKKPKVSIRSNRGDSRGQSSEQYSGIAARGQAGGVSPRVPDYPWIQETPDIDYAGEHGPYMDDQDDNGHQDYLDRPFTQSVAPASSEDESSEEDANAIRAQHTQQLLGDCPFPRKSATNGGQSSNNPQRPSHAALNAVTVQLLDRSMATSTQQGYRNAMNHFKQFHTAFYPNIHILPITEHKLAQFITWCHSRCLKPSTITTFVSAISYVHRINSFKNPTESFMIKKLLYGLRRDTVPDKRLPFTIIHLERLTSALKTLNLGTLISLTLRAMFSVAFFGMFRAGELSLSKTGQNNVILRQNVSIEFSNGKPTKVNIIMPSYKHSQGKIAQIPLVKQSIKAICPVRALDKLFRLHTYSMGPLFQYPCGNPINTSFFRSTLRKCVLICDLDPQKYTTHSFRIGGATMAHEHHYSSDQIQKLGRWKSSAFKKYIRPVQLPLI